MSSATRPSSSRPCLDRRTAQPPVFRLQAWYPVVHRGGAGRPDAPDEVGLVGEPHAPGSMGRAETGGTHSQTARAAPAFRAAARTSPGPPWTSGSSQERPVELERILLAPLVR